MRKVVIGSRESRLAVIQSEIVKKYIEEQNPDIQVEILTMKTTGDIILDRTLDKIGGKGLFVKELDKALLEKRSDISVHSLKDMPMEVSGELPLAAYSRREDPRDVLVLPKGREIMDKTKPIGCSSLRRILQLKELFPDMAFKSVRGNVLTRLRKLDDGEYGAPGLWFWRQRDLRGWDWKRGSAGILPFRRSSLQQVRESWQSREEQGKIFLIWPIFRIRKLHGQLQQRGLLSGIWTGDVPHR